MRFPSPLPSQGCTQEWMRNSKGNSLRTVVSSSIHVIVWWGMGVSFWSVWLRLKQRWHLIKSVLLFLALGVLNFLFKALRDGSHSKYYSTMTYILLLLVLQSAAAFEHFLREALVVLHFHVCCWLKVLHRGPGLGKLPCSTESIDFR